MIGVIIWRDLPDILQVSDIAEAMEISERSARRVAEDAGAIKVSGKWYLAKKKLMALLGDED